MPEPLKHVVASLWQHWPYTTAAVVVIAFLIAKVFPILKELLGFKKQTLDIKKAGLEVKELERKEMAVRLASLDEIKEYDPTTKKLTTWVGQERPRYYGRAKESDPSRRILFWIILLVACILGAGLIAYFLR